MYYFIYIKIITKFHILSQIIRNPFSAWFFIFYKNCLSIQEEEIWHQPERVGDPHVPEADQLPILGGDDLYLHGRLKGRWRVYVLYDNSYYHN